jgi:hypothetical protein
VAVDRDDHDERQARIEQMMRDAKRQRPLRTAKATLAPRHPQTSTTHSRKRPRRK